MTNIYFTKMSRNFIKITFLIFSVVFSSYQAVQAQSDKPTVRRNSPFAPNPKRRTEPSANLKIAEDTDSTVVSVNQTLIKEDTSRETDTARIAEKVDFERQTIAKKTLEIAKRANEANVSPVEVYKIGKGDVLFISLQNAPSRETNYFTVLENGTIDYPLAGEMVAVEGMTAEAVEDYLKEKIKLYENPQVSVKVREFNSHTYTVLGAVERAGEKKLQREAVPLFVVRAESVVDPKVSSVKIRRKNSDVQEVELKDDSAGNTLVFAGDIVEFVAEEAKESPKNVQFYYIAGEISEAGQKDFHQGLTLTQAIMAAGGLKKPTVKKVIIRRKKEDGTLAPMEVNLKAVKDGKAIDPALQAGDTIEVGN